MVERVKVALVLASGIVVLGVAYSGYGLWKRHRDFDVQASAGQTALAKEDYAKAVEYFEAATRIAPESPALRTDLALSRIGSGDIPRAIEELETAARQDASSYRADALLITIFLKNGRYDRALEAIGALEKKLPNSAFVHNLRGAAYLGKKDFTRARDSFEKALAIQPDYFAAASLAQLDLQANQSHAAEERFKSLLARDPKNARAMVAMAGFAYTAGDEQGYLSWLENAARADPKALAARAWLVKYWLDKNDTGKALVYAQEAAKAEPDNPQALEILGQTQFAAGDKPSALATYKKLAEKAPRPALGFLKLAGAQSLANDLDGARASLTQALKVEPGNVEGQASLAALEIRAKNYGEALGPARQLQKTEPKLNLGYVLEGDVRMAQGKYTDAAASYESAYKIQQSGPLVIKLHRAYGAAGQGAIGESKAMEWLKAKPNDVEVRLYLAQAHMNGHDYPAAIGQYETILTLAPKSLVALNNLAWLYQQNRDPRALSLAEGAYELQPDSAAVIDTLGFILVERGDYRRGLDLLRQASSKAPEAANVHWHLAYGLYRSGDKTRARQELKNLRDGGVSFPEEKEAWELRKQLGD